MILKMCLTYFGVCLPYFTWSDHSTLRVLGSASNDAIKLLDEFDFQLNCTELIASYPIPHLSSDMIPNDPTGTHTVLAIRCDQELYNCTLQYVYDMKSLMVEKCDITLHCLQLLAVRPNPTIIYWTIPKCVVELVSSKVPVHSDYLYSRGVQEVLVYPEPLLATSDCVRIGSLAFVADSKTIPMRYSCLLTYSTLSHQYVQYLKSNFEIVSMIILMLASRVLLYYYVMIHLSTLHTITTLFYYTRNGLLYSISMKQREQSFRKSLKRN